jgi:hypothetical protein
MRQLSLFFLLCFSHFSALADAAEPLYLRCDCNWWKALPEYQLQQIGSTQLYRTEIEIKNASFPINFKLVDAEFTPGKNFGYLTTADRQIQLGRVFKASSHAVKENFEFHPPTTGTYQVYLDLRDEQPLVFISKSI